jgi:U3 small nucleolar RNA-associated protein 12
MALGGISAEKYVLNVVAKVKAASLQDALLVLPFEHVEIMIGFITIWATKVRLGYRLLTSGMEY